MENTEQKTDITEMVEIKPRKSRKPRSKKAVPEIIMSSMVEPTISYSKSKELARKPRVQSEKQIEALAKLVAKNKQRKQDRLDEEARILEVKLNEEKKEMKAYRVRPKKTLPKRLKPLKVDVSKDKSEDENDDYDSDPETTDGTRVIRKTISKIAEIDKTINNSIQVNPYAALLKRHYL